MLKKYYVEDPIYSQIVELFIGPHEEFIAMLKKRHPNFEDDSAPSDGLSIWLQGVDGAYYFYVWFCEFDESPRAYERLVHELHHASWHLNLLMGVSLKEDNHEPFAYYCGFLVREFLKKLKPQKKKRNNGNRK